MFKRKYLQNFESQHSNQYHLLKERNLNLQMYVLKLRTALSFLPLLAKDCNKDTIFDNLGTISLERDLKTRQITLSAFRALTVQESHFAFENCQNSFSWGPSFDLFSSAKYLNFRGESCEIRILFRSIQETYTLRKVKKQVLLFLMS